MITTSRFHAATLVAVSAFAASTAHAADPTKKECIDANAQAQTQQKEGKLRAAQSSLRLCTSPACPTAVRDDCAQRLDELERTIPSLVFEAKDGAGADVTAVRVQLDGQLLAEKLDGTALAVDPGDHTFTFEVAGQPPVTKKLVIREGDRGRRERITLGATGAAQTVPAVAPLPSPPSSAEPQGPSESMPSDSGHVGSGQRTTGIVLGISGLVGLGVGGLFAGLASSSWSSSQTNCRSASDCLNHTQAVSDRDSASSKATVSTIAFVAGGALLAGGLVVYLTAPKHDSAPATAVRVVPGVGGAMVVGNF